MQMFVMGKEWLTFLLRMTWTGLSANWTELILMVDQLQSRRTEAVGETEAVAEVVAVAEEADEAGPEAEAVGVIKEVEAEAVTKEVAVAADLLPETVADRLQEIAADLRQKTMIKKMKAETGAAVAVWKRTISKQISLLLFF
mmetsp:Transcript_35545/g.43958  ORF Transcript_35545/g.43958 Transcript_35545/m.43958 type:complete len:142 (+) Transcript_35545:641-1066(+)